AVLYSPTGKKLWRYALAGFLERPSGLEIRDVHYQDGALYLNQSCQGGARDPVCDRIIAVDTGTGELAWRSPPDSSTYRFDVLDTHIVGHGRTSVVVLDRGTGAALDRRSVPF